MELPLWVISLNSRRWSCLVRLQTLKLLWWWIVGQVRLIGTTIGSFGSSDLSFSGEAWGWHILGIFRITPWFFNQFGFSYHCSRLLCFSFRRVDVILEISWLDARKCQNELQNLTMHFVHQGQKITLTGNCSLLYSPIFEHALQKLSGIVYGVVLWLCESRLQISFLEGPILLE